MAPEHHRHPEPQADGNRQIDVLATEALDDENLSRSKDSAAAPKPVFKQGRAPGNDPNRANGCHRQAQPQHSPGANPKPNA